MSTRPRELFIGSDTYVRLNELKNTTTGQLIIGAVGGTLEIYNGIDNAIRGSFNLTELTTEPGTYEALVPDTFFDALPGAIDITEGTPLLLIFDISGGPGLGLRVSARGVAVTKKDEVGLVSSSSAVVSS